MKSNLTYLQGWILLKEKRIPFKVLIDLQPLCGVKLLFLLLLFFFASCKHTPENKKFITTELRYSTYMLHRNQDSNRWEFHLADYFHVDSSGHFDLIKHNPDTFDRHFYLKGNLDDSIRKTIDSILLENKYHPDITLGLPDTPLIIYNGFNYVLDYKLIDKANTKIQYVRSSSRTPENILFLTTFFNTVFSNPTFNRIDSFSIEPSYLDTLKKISLYTELPPARVPQFQPPPGFKLRFKASPEEK